MKLKLNPTEGSTRPAALLVLFCCLFASTFALADRPDNTLELKNTSRNLLFTKPIVALCPRNVAPAARVGDPASTALEYMAEAGDTSFLATQFALDGCSYIELPAPVAPGETTTFDLKGPRSYNLFVYFMFLPTNDGFGAGPGMSIRRLRKLDWVDLRAYDSGTELNDGDCANIPGPLCGGEGFNADRSDVVDYVHAHPGFTGVGGLLSNEYGLASPVAQIRLVK
ncbi:TPA: hypothetical protein EYP38_02260 [Candidatus Micrarchaeota archaeon]|nr:hypothetical protein [Candidatus Micrarchaeota archaeon]